MFAVLSDGVSPEMNVIRMHVCCSRAAGSLILQLAVIAAAQQSAPPSDPAPWSSAPPGKLAAESSQNQDRLAPADPARQRITQPGKAGGSGDPAFGGERHPLYRLSKSDTIDINFALSSDFNQSLTIQPDGFVALRGAGSLFAEGLTVLQLQQAIVAAYRGILHDPEVTVTLKEFEKPYFLAAGEVVRPGKYELRGDLTVHEAIAIAGGFTQQARHSQVVLFRRISAGVAESHLIDVKKMLNSRNLHEDLHLEAGDFVFVPQNRVSKIRRYVPTSAMSWYMNPLQF
jgi:polysaccharide export outer membrane protein